MKVTFRGDDVLGFDAPWDEVLISLKETPQDDILESMYEIQFKDSEQLKTTFVLYNQEIVQT